MLIYTASGSGIDNFGRYKALHYAAKKFYAPVAMGLFMEDATQVSVDELEPADIYRMRVRGMISIKSNEGSGAGKAVQMPPHDKRRGTCKQILRFRRFC